MHVLLKTSKMQQSRVGKDDHLLFPQKKEKAEARAKVAECGNTESVVGKK